MADHIWALTEIAEPLDWPGFGGQSLRVAERTLTEREAYHAARHFLEQFNERERSEAIMLLIEWMKEGRWEHDPLGTSDPAQWHDWVACVDGVIAEERPNFTAQCSN